MIVQKGHCGTPKKRTRQPPGQKENSLLGPMNTAIVSTSHGPKVVVLPDLGLALLAHGRPERLARLGGPNGRLNRTILGAGQVDGLLLHRDLGSQG